MKDSQHFVPLKFKSSKYIKANNERFSTAQSAAALPCVSISRRIMKDSQQSMLERLRRVSISRRIMKDSQQRLAMSDEHFKYIKANNERFSTYPCALAFLY